MWLADITVADPKNQITLENQPVGDGWKIRGDTPKTKSLCLG